MFSSILESIDSLLWTNLAMPVMILLGLLLSWQLRFPQIIKFPNVVQNFVQMLRQEKTEYGIRPIFAFFTSIGGCIGIGNIIAVCTAVQIGGPGALFWIWVAALLGMMIKYSEVYLGIIFRVKNDRGGYDGGRLMFLQKAFGSHKLSIVFALLFAIYGTEVFMFNVVSTTVTQVLHINHLYSVLGLLALILITVKGGANRVGQVCSLIIPVFLIIFILMAGYVLFHNASQILPCLKTVVVSAFSGHAALGAFAGSGVLVTMSQGIARGCYTGDIGVGYAGIIHAESSSQDPIAQAKLAVFGIFLDTFVVCTLSILIILVTGVWQQGIPAATVVQVAFAQYFPGMDWFMALFIFLVGYSSLIAFFLVGLKCMRFVSNRFGEKFYYLYAICAMFVFGFIQSEVALTVMSITGGLLLIINLIAIVKLRKQIRY